MMYKKIKLENQNVI